MAVYVDNVRIAWRGQLWCHLVADSIEELHQFAHMLGLRRKWFQQSASYPHYDVTVQVRELAIELGALLGSRKQIIGCARRMKDELHVQSRKVPEQLQLFC